MEMRSFAKFALAVGVALLFVSAVADQEIQAKNEVESTLSIGFVDQTAQEPRNDVSVNMDHTADITFTPAFTAYLPVIVNSPPSIPGIYGQATYQGTPIGGIELTLQQHINGSFYPVLTTTTQSDGRYLFTNVPDLAEFTAYVVRYMNDGNPQYLGYYYSTFLGYSQGAGGDFDIANIVLVSPPNGATVALPYTFQWVPRSDTPSDNYSVVLACRTADWRYIHPVGYTGNFYLDHAPSADCRDYWWLVEVMPSPDPTAGVIGGVSYEIRAVSFSNTRN